MNTLKKFDLFAKEFTFTTFKESKYVTFPGFVFSLTLVILIILTIIYFGVDFYYRKNPTVNFQEVIGSTYTRTDLTSQNFLLPWAITDSNNNILNVSNIIYPSVTYLKYSRDSSGSLQLTNQVNLTWKNCSSFNYVQLTPAMKNFNCLNLNDLNLTFGGFWDGEFVEYFMINLFYCENLDTYSPTGNCTPINKLNAFLNDNYPYFSIFYPNLHFSSNLPDNALKTEYVNYYSQINLGLSKRDYFFFEKTYLLDDQGWLISENQTYSVYATASQTSTYTLFPISEYNSTSTNSIIYSSVFYLRKNYGLYTRSYMKLQNLAAIVGGVINIIQILFSILYSFINLYLRDITLINEMFDFETEHNTNPKKITFLSINFKRMQSAKPTESMKYQNSEFPKFHNELESRRNLGNQISIEDKINQIIFERTMTQDKEIKLNPGFYLVFKDFLCCSRLNNEEEIKKLEIFEISRDFVHERLDVGYYIKSLEAIDKLKLVVLNYSQNISLEFMNKPNLYVKENIEVIKKMNNPDKQLQVKQIIEYYSEKHRTSDLTDIDFKIFQHIDSEIKALVKLNSQEPVIHN